MIELRGYGKVTVCVCVCRHHCHWTGSTCGLAPTGTHLDLTAPNVFIRALIGPAPVGSACQPHTE